MLKRAVKSLRYTCAGLADRVAPVALPSRGEPVRVAFVFHVESASALHAKLKEAGVKFVHEEPMHMGGDNYWFQFFDPAGNILEAVGAK